MVLATWGRREPAKTDRSEQRARRLGLVVLGILGVAAAAAVSVALAVPSGPKRRAASLETATMPLAQVVRLFIYHAVERRQPALAWGIVTDAIKTETTRAEWNRGTMRVVPVLSRTSLTVHTRTLERRKGERLLLVDLSQPNGSEGDGGEFLIRVALRRQHWLVSYWGPAMLIGAPLGVSHTIRTQPAFKT